MLFLPNHDDSRLLGRLSDHIIYDEYKTTLNKVIIFNFTGNEITVYINDSSYKVYHLTSRAIPHYNSKDIKIIGNEFEINLNREIYRNKIFLSNINNTIDYYNFLTGYKYWINKNKKQSSQITIISKNNYTVYEEEDDSYSYYIYLFAIMLGIFVLIVIAYGFIVVIKNMLN